MFKEAQLYAPVTTGADGTVTVHLADDHPGFADPEYRARRNHIASLALDWQPSKRDSTRQLHGGGTGGMAHGLPGAGRQA